VSVRLEPMDPWRAYQIHQWRNLDLSPWRTPYMLTAEMQREWYDKVVCDRKADSRYFAVVDTDLDLVAFDSLSGFVGVVGLTNIQWENGTAEVALQIGPEFARQGYGEAALDKILCVAFNQLRLLMVYGECYECNPAVDFWRKMVERKRGYWTTLPNRKYWEGEQYDSLYFSFDSWVTKYV